MVAVAPQVLQNLLLAKRACFELGMAGEAVDLWEAYTLAQVDVASPTQELERLASPAGNGSVGATVRKRLEAVRSDTMPLVEYLRQALPGSVPQLSDPKAVDLALVFIMTTPPARDAVIKWFKNPAASRDQAMKLLGKIAAMVESYQKAMADAEGPPSEPAKPPAPVAPPPDLDETERLLQERINAQRKSREKSITERRTKEKDDAERLAKTEAAKQEAERKAEADRIEKAGEDDESLARKKAAAERMAAIEAQAAEATR